MKWKKLLTILLCVMLLWTLLPAGAFASEDVEVNTTAAVSAKEVESNAPTIEAVEADTASAVSAEEDESNVLVPETAEPQKAIQTEPEEQKTIDDSKKTISTDSDKKDDQESLGQTRAVSGADVDLSEKKLVSTDPADSVASGTEKKTNAEDVVFTVEPEDTPAQAVGSSPLKAAATCSLELYYEPEEGAGTIRRSQNSPYHVGDTVTVTAVPSSSYDFIYWYDDNVHVYKDNPVQITLEGDTELTAVFRKKGEYFLYYRTNGLVFTPDQNSYAPGTRVMVSLPAAAGRAVRYSMGQDVDGNGSSVTYVAFEGDSFVMPAYDVWVKAELAYGITLSPAEHGSLTVNPASGPYCEGDTVTVTAQPSSGYHLSEINGIPAEYTASGNSFSFKMPDRDLTIGAKFEENGHYNINFGKYPTGAGSVSGSGNDSTGEVTATATPAENYRFGYWADSEDLNTPLATDNPYTFVPQKDMTLVAVFVPITYRVYPATNIQHGTLTLNPDKTYYSPGETITLIGDPEEGYMVDYYAVGKVVNGSVPNITRLEGNTFDMPAYDVAVTAVFVPDSAIAIEADTDTLPAVAQGQSFSVPIRVTSNPGFAGAQITLSYDSSRLTLDSFKLGGFADPASPGRQGVENLQYIRVGDTTTETGVLFYANFTVKDDADDGTVSIGFDKKDIVSQNADDLSAYTVFTPGTVIIGNDTPSPESDFTFDAELGMITGYRGSGGRVVIPSSIGGVTVTTIRFNAFEGNSNMTSVMIPASVTKINGGAFSDCKNLRSVTFQPGSQLEVINGAAFEGCSALESIFIPDGVGYIAQDTFNGCSSLKSVVFGNNVGSFQHGAFRDCTSLESITIGSNVDYIGDEAFWNCNNLKAVYISDLSKWCAISFASTWDNPLRYAQHLYLNGTEITDLTIPSDVTSISNYAFYGGTGFTSVTIPAGVTSIGRYTFGSCRKLKDIYFEGTAEQWDEVSKGDYWNGDGPEGQQIHVLCTVSVAAEPTAGGSVTIAPSPNATVPGTYKEGTAVTLTAAPNEGYEFVSWTEKGSVVPGAGAEYSFEVSEDRELAANFALKDFTVTVEGGTAAIPTAKMGDTVTITADTPEGFAFSQWAQVDGVEFDNAAAAETTFIMPAKDVAVSAVFLKIFTVRWLDGDGSVLQEKTYIDGEEAPAFDGENPTKTATKQYTYAFSAWNDGTVDGTTTTYKPLFVETLKQYNVTFVDHDGKTVLKEAAAYDYGTPASEIVLPEKPVREADAQYTYTFAGWDPVVEEVTEDATYKATYTATPVPVKKGTLTFDLGGGTLDGKTGTITIEANVGDTIKLPGAPTREGYTFQYWKGSKYEAGAEYKVEGDHAFTAEWKKNSSSLSGTQSTTNTAAAKTGDESNVGLWFMLLAASLLSLIMILTRGRKYRRN